MSSRTNAGIIAAATVALLSLTACVGSGADPASQLTADAAASETEAYGNAPDALRTRGDGRASLADSDESADRPRVDAPTVAVISTGHVSLETSDVTTARREVQQVIDTHLGTISEEEAATNDEGVAESTRIVIRVPSKHFARAMADLEGVARLRSSTSSAEDVTTQVIDNDVRLRAQEKSLERVEALLARAENLNEVIAIESQLARRQADYDSLRSTQAWLKDQTSLSTITLTLQLDDGDRKQERDATGFLAGLDRGWDGLLAALTGLGTLLGLALPFAALVALIGIPLGLALRAARRRRAEVS